VAKASNWLISFEERFGKSAVLPQRLKIRPRNFSGRTNQLLRIGKFLCDRLGDGERMHAVEEISSHQAVAAPAKHVQPGAARDQYANAIGIRVEQTLQKSFPSAVFVQLIQHRDDGLFLQAIQAQSPGDPGWTREDNSPVVLIVPVQVLLGGGLTRRRFAHLSRAGDKRHLPMTPDVIGENTIIEADSWLFHI
jgi:hypothetical protein